MLTTEELYELTFQTLVKAVMEKLMERQKRALVVYTGSNMGFEPALAALSRLRDEGFTYRVLLSRGAANILNVETIRAALRPEEFWVEKPGESPEALTKQYDTILVPALTVNTAAHVASCMADSPTAAVILDGLMRGKNVIAAIDGACPDNPERAVRGFNMAEPLKGKLRENLEILRSYGARLTTSDRLYDKTHGALLGWLDTPKNSTLGAGAAVKEPMMEAVRAEGAKAYACGAELPGTYASKIAPFDGSAHRAHGSGRADVANLGGKVLGGRYVRSCPPHSVLRVPKGTLITQMAADEAARQDVHIVIDET